MTALPVFRQLLTEHAPTLLVIVDTEEEFDWNAPFDPTSTSTANIGFQHRAQHVFEAHGVVPTYVVDYPVASTQSSIGVLRPWLEAGRCDIGAHLHPWVNPPATEPVNAFNSYACNLPADLFRAKLSVLTQTITTSFGQAPATYKAGRYGVGTQTLPVLRELGYMADASVVPHTDFRADGGPDFRAAPDRPFLLAGDLVEIPLSVHFVGRIARAGTRLFPLFQRARRWRLPGLAARLGLLERLRLTPEGHAATDMIRQTHAALDRGERIFALTYHSSSLMPGGSPYATSAADCDGIVRSLREYLEFFFRLPAARSVTARSLAASALEWSQGARA